MYKSLGGRGFFFFCAGFEQSTTKCYTSCFVSGCTLTRGLTVAACSANLKPKAAPVITSLSLPESSHPVLMTSGPSGSWGLEGSETSYKCLKTAILKKTGKDNSSFLVPFLFLLIFYTEYMELYATCLTICSFLYWCSSLAKQGSQTQVLESQTPAEIRLVYALLTLNSAPTGLDDYQKIWRIFPRTLAYDTGVHSFIWDAD